MSDFENLIHAVDYNTTQARSIDYDLTMDQKLDIQLLDCEIKEYEGPLPQSILQNNKSYLKKLILVNSRTNKSWVITHKKEHRSVMKRNY